MNFGFSMVFFAVWPGGRRCANCRDAHFFERYCDESIFTWKTFKTTMEKTKKTKSSDPWARSGERPGRGHGSELFVFFVFFGFSMVFCSLAKTSRTQKKTKTKSSDPWARSGLSTHKPKNQKTKKPRNQKTKKTKKQKTKKNKKKQDCTPQGEGVRCRVLGLVFLFFLGFFFFCFLVFWFVCG